MSALQSLEVELTVEKESIILPRALDKPAHSVDHILPCRPCPVVARRISKKENLRFGIVMIVYS